MVQALPSPAWVGYGEVKVVFVVKDICLTIWEHYVLGAGFDMLKPAPSGVSS